MTIAFLVSILFPSIPLNLLVLPFNKIVLTVKTLTENIFSTDDLISILLAVKGTANTILLNSDN